MAEIKKMIDTDLRKTLKEKENALRNFRFSIAGSKTRNVREGRGLRREIARILTEIRSRSAKK